ncbi:hypothetical protein, partial [Pantoea piersonii]|uniref:hypothetical protein n=1 Tax=Pantoea piersonii TaxID=2364647 RepID=UPI002899D99E
TLLHIYRVPLRFYWRLALRMASDKPPFFPEMVRLLRIIPNEGNYETLAGAIFKVIYLICD